MAAAATSGGKHAGAVEEVNKRAKETKAAEAVSRLVNYVAAVRFHGFEHAERECEFVDKIRLFLRGSFLQGRGARSKCPRSTRPMRYPIC